MNKRTIATALALLAASACEERAAQRSWPSAAQTSEAHTRAKRNVPWPDGWMAVSEDDWLPALNTVGRELCTAHRYFVGAELAVASNHVSSAAGALRSMANGNEDDGASELVDAAVRLERLAARLKGGEELTREQLERTLIEAHRVGVHWEWSHPGEEGFAALLEMPRTHFQRAHSMLKANAHAGAAVRVRRGSAYLRVAARGARAEDRKALEAQVDRVQHLAHDADLGALSLAALQDALTRTDAAIAESYLREAEARYEARQSAEAERALRVAAAYMRAQLDWAQARAESPDVAGELEHAAHAIARGARPSRRRIADLVARATRALQAPAAPAAES